MIQRGYTNRILSVDLSTGTITTPELDTTVRDYFLGGRSLGLYLLHKAITSRTRPDDPENPLIIANGPLGGIPQFPGTAKAMAVSLSPLTGIPGVSNFGGYFGAYLKYAGFDALQVTGIADRDVVIVVNAYKSEVTIEEGPSDDEAFDLERDIAEHMTSAGYDKRHIAFLSTGIGAANTNYGCINSHYFDVTKPVDGAQRPVSRQAGGPHGNRHRHEQEKAPVHHCHDRKSARRKSLRRSGLGKSKARRSETAQGREGRRSAFIADAPQGQRGLDHLHEQNRISIAAGAQLSGGIGPAELRRSAAGTTRTTCSIIGEWMDAFPAATSSAPRVGG